MIKICLMQNSGFFYLVKENLEQFDNVKVVSIPPADLLLIEDEDITIQELLGVLDMYRQQKTILFTDKLYDATVLELLHVGVSSILRKRTFNLEELMEVLNRILHGEFFMPTDMIPHFLEKLIRLKDVQHDQFLHQIQGRNCNLTLTEAKVAGLMRENYSNKEIATLLGLSDGSVKVHVSQIYTKLGTNERDGVIEKLVEFSEQ